MTRRILLAIDTATRRGGVAVRALDETEAVLARRTYEGTTDHAERLLSAIDEALREAAASPRDVSVVATSVGPGSFTGVRVGVATAKGLAIANGAKVVAIGSLETIAAGATAQAVRVALLDAKRGEAFAAAFGPDGSEVAAPMHLRVEDVVPWARALATDVVLLGEAVALLPPHDLPVSRAPETDLPDPGVLSAIAAARARAGVFADPVALQPTYVRPPDAVPLDRPEPARLESLAHGGRRLRSPRTAPRPFREDVLRGRRDLPRGRSGR